MVLLMIFIKILKIIHTLIDLIWNRQFKGFE